MLWLTFIATCALIFLLPGFLGEDRGKLMALAICSLGFLVEFSWPLRREWWFWSLVMTFIILNVTGLYSLDWSWIIETKPNGKVVSEIGFADFLAMTGVTYGVYRLMFGRPDVAVEPSIDDLPSYADRDLNI